MSGRSRGVGLGVGRRVKDRRARREPFANRYASYYDTFDSVSRIVFDEGQDTGPDDFGLAVLDNIDVNKHLIGQGPGN